MFLATLVALGLSAAPAQATNARSFISSTGSDANPCTRALPCRTLQTAHNNTAASGEINFLDPAGYGTLTITKAISIVNDGVGSAGVLVTSGAIGITINAGMNDAINLRGLIIEGTGVGSVGIQFNSGGSLTIGNSVIRGLTNGGIRIDSTTSSKLVVSNTLIADNNPSAAGIVLHPIGAVKVDAALNRVEIINNASYGLFATGVDGSGVRVVITDCRFGYNPFGIGARSFPGEGPVEMFVISTAIGFSSAKGIHLNGAMAVLVLDKSAVGYNAVEWELLNSAQIITLGNNAFGNGGPNIGTLTPGSLN
jgi:hypothetical protein